MKILLSWILDHITVTRKEVDADSLFKRLNATTAEIDDVKLVRTDLSTLFVARIISATAQDVILDCPELKKSITIPLRKDANEAQGFWMLIKKEGSVYRFATLVDVGSEKDGLMPPLAIDENDIHGGWRNKIEEEEYVVTIDNKALTNRPDLWGHRGFAREVAALLGKELKPEDYFLITKTIKHFENRSNGGPITLEISQQSDSCGNPCKRLAGIVLPTIAWQPSLLPMAVRLARVDSRPLDALVDMTNYVMFDIGQPMHAFDADALGNRLVGRCAHDGEKLQLLDGEEITLTSSDYVMTDGEKPVALAGIMGGTTTAVHRGTTSLLLESANFDATTIRRTATRCKKRTESSARFEKSLDPNQNTTALLRYLKLLEDAQITYEAADVVMSLGPLARDKQIDITHALIEQKIGVALAQNTVEHLLTRLGFGVRVKKIESEGRQGFLYEVTVPPFRSTKDVTIPEDIIEEVARFVGYGNIPETFPVREMKAFDIQPLERMRTIKKIFAYGLHMHEVQTYAFFDEEFLAKLTYDPEDALRIANPQSEHWQRLVTSLIPNLIKCVAVNPQQEQLSFFEHNRVWFFEEKPVETQEVAGIWYHQKKEIDFYEQKASLEMLFDSLKLSIRWEKPMHRVDPWYDSHRMAELWHKDRIVGRAGCIAKPFLHKIADGDAFIFELDANVLTHGEQEKVHFRPLKKYPATDLDMSMLVPVECTVAGIERIIGAADSRIKTVECIDSFEKPEWVSKKSLTFRFEVYDENGTLTKEMIDEVWAHAVESVRAIGAEVR